MKKLILAAFALLTFSAASYAQDSQAKKTAPAKVKSTATAKKTTEKATAMDKADETPATNATATGTVLKKDGTPDKRYKAKAPVKKDGTPDMRYKANQPKPKS